MTKPIEIQVPDENWMSWPDEPGWYLCGKPREESILLLIAKLTKHYILASSQGPFEKTEGYRFARVSLPTVPEIPK